MGEQRKDRARGQRDAREIDVIERELKDSPGVRLIEELGLPRDVPRLERGGRHDGPDGHRGPTTLDYEDGQGGALDQPAVVVQRQALGHGEAAEVRVTRQADGIDEGKVRQVLRDAHVRTAGREATPRRLDLYADV